MPKAFVVVSAIAAVILFGCSAQQPPALMNVVQLDARARAGQQYEPATSGERLLYASDYAYCSCVRVFVERTGALVGLISEDISEPRGIAIDGAGNLYVENAAVDYLWIYPPGQVYPSDYFTELGQIPTAIAIGGNGNVYVSNSGPTASVFVYKPGIHTPTRMLFDGTAVTGGAIGIDNHNNLYWGFMTADGTGHVDEFVKGMGKPIDTGIHFSHLGAPVAFTFSKYNRLIASEANQVDVFALPNTLIKSFAQGTSPNGLALNSVGHIFVANGNASQIQAYTYPGGVLSKTIVTPNFIPYGLAQSPP